MSTQSPLLDITLWDAGISQPDLIFNDAVRKLDVLVAGKVISRTTDAQPGSPTEGDAYIITGSATGTDWTTFSQHDLAYYSGGAWVAWTPTGFYNVMVGDESYLTIYWNGSAWVGIPSYDLSADTTPQLGGDLDTNGHQVQWSKGADVASATALPVLTDGNYFDVTGTTTITSINTTKVGTFIGLHFDGILILTHHATDLILPGGANITTQAGDEAFFIEYATGDYRCVSYLRADGTPIVGGGGGGLTVEFKTASFTAEAGKKYKVDSTGGAVVVTLPAGNDLDNIVIQDVAHYAATNNITVNPDGAETIDNDTSYVIDQNEGWIDIGYKNADTNWEVAASGMPYTLIPTKTRTVRTLIETITNGTGAVFDFNNIPAGYDRLIIKGNIRSEAVAILDGAHIYLNADTTASNYHSQQCGGHNGAASMGEGAYPNVALIAGASSVSNEYAQVTIEIENPGSSYNKTALGRVATNFSTDELFTGVFAVNSIITAAITRIRIDDDAASGLLFGDLSLYGEQDEEIGGGNSFAGVNLQTGTTYTFTPNDLNQLVSASNASASTYSIPDSFLSVGAVLSLYNAGAGEVTVSMAGGASDTIETSANKCAQYKGITLIKRTATSWVVVGGTA
jgi:hypothetical protein